MSKLTTVLFKMQNNKNYSQMWQREAEELPKQGKEWCKTELAAKKTA